MSVIGRYLLYATPGFEVAVLRTKRLYARRDFQGDEMTVSANNGLSDAKVAIGHKPPKADIMDTLD